MANNKNQHYVPRCYLKPFTVDRAGKAINLFNIKSGRFISNAPVKNQCAKDYFYGQDLIIEKSLSSLEGFYATILLKIENKEELDNEDLYALQKFTYLQYMRTEHAMKRTSQQAKDFNQTIFGEEEIEKEDNDFLMDEGHEPIMITTMKMCVSSWELVEDLKICIFENNTKHPFITSDDPSIFTSRFQLQKLKQETFGVGAAGVVFFLPVTPRFLVIFYDGGVYTLPDKRGQYLEIDEEDVHALNHLQFLRSSTNLYFSDFCYNEELHNRFKYVEPSRPNAWCITRIAVPDLNWKGEGERYVVVQPEEARRVGKAIIHQVVLHPQPAKWVSKLQYRRKPIYYLTGNARKCVRKVFLDWEIRRRLYDNIAALDPF